MVGRQNLDIADTLRLRDAAMATTFWLLMAYNFRCVKASGMIFDSRGGFSGSSYPMKTLPFQGSKGRCHGNQFWDYNCYNWLCVNDSNLAVGYEGGLSGQPTKCR